jgi:hypothetical protein
MMIVIKGKNTQAHFLLFLLLFLLFLLLLLLPLHFPAFPSSPDVAVPVQLVIRA